MSDETATPMPSASERRSTVTVIPFTCEEYASNAPKANQSYSIFGDSACGEPSRSQHLVIDFTPIEGVDTDSVQQKCFAFWEFVHSHPELQGMVVKPEKESNQKATDASGTDAENSMRDEQVKLEKTAVDMLESIENNGIIDGALGFKMPCSQCTLGPREYVEKELPASNLKPSMFPRRKLDGSFPGIRMASGKPVRKEDAHAAPDVREMCKNMSDWDQKHPKCMQPPGHPPALSTCIMQRKLPTLY